MVQWKEGQSLASLCEHPIQCEHLNEKPKQNNGVVFRFPPLTVGGSNMEKLTASIIPLLAKFMIRGGRLCTLAAWLPEGAKV